MFTRSREIIEVEIGSGHLRSAIRYYGDEAPLAIASLMVTVVLDVGKTHSKLSALEADGTILGVRRHANRTGEGPALASGGEKISGNLISHHAGNSIKSHAKIGFTHSLAARPERVVGAIPGEKAG